MARDFVFLFLLQASGSLYMTWRLVYIVITVSTIVRSFKRLNIIMFGRMEIRFQNPILYDVRYSLGLNGGALYY